MPIPVTCACGQHLETSERNAGRRARCPVCGRETTVPVPLREAESIRRESGPATSGKATASLALGACVFLAFLGGVPAILLGLRALGDIGRSGGRLKGRGRAVAGIGLGLVGCLLTLAPLPLLAAREEARRAWCANNLKQIGLALQNYHDSNDCLPPAAIADKAGRPLLSWRVAILPYMDPSSLYNDVHLDEPWDSPHNLALLDRMPSFYACPSDRARRPGMTGYQAVVGPAAAFPPDFKPVPFSDFADGLGTTLLLGESRRAVPWTKPEDLPLEAALPPAGLGSDHGYGNNGFHALFADGSVRFLKDTLAPSVLRAFLTRNGKEEVSSESD